MDEEIIFYQNLWWPKISQTLGKVRPDILSTIDVGPRKVAKYCKNRRVVVQAGGNCGVYPKIYSELFETVYTFEPEPLNFFCLNKNAQNKNIIKIQACLGDSHKLVNVTLPASNFKKGINIGTYQISGSGDFPMLKIDDLNLNVCDLIHLDIEGFEGSALIGSLETIRRCSPTICLEINGLGGKNGWSFDRLSYFLSELNYIQIEKTEDDYIFVHKS